jgi:preprotein translocase subunit SecD
MHALPRGDPAVAARDRRPLLVARPGPSSRGQLHVYRYLGALLAVFVALYAVVAFAGKGSAWLTPKLGLDLQGGAQVILTPKTESGKKVTASQLSTAVEILRQRVNGAGVSEAEVVSEGDQIIVQVPGGNRDSIATATQTAQLQMRRVVEAQQVFPTAPQPTSTPTKTPATVGTPTPKATANKRPVTAGLLAATPTPTATPAATATPTPSASPTEAAPLVRSGDVYSPQAFALLDCSNPRARLGGAPDAPTKDIIACDRNGAEKYHLAVAKVVGKDVKGANTGTDQLGTQIQVNVQFKGKGQDNFTNLTKEAFGATPPTNRVAIVLDGVVYSAPTIENVINGDAQITGGFTQKAAQDLANVLKFGALPVTFVAGDAEVVSASLGDDQLRSGLIAGGIGLVAVVLYSLLYYRALGLVTIASLLVSGGLVYASVCILGKEIGFALSLAGIAGFIVAVGITADSFVVYFERLKDEIKEGRTPRSAVDVAWKRAFRTILNADAVSLLAAIILYVVSVGGVRGFAFTLGLSTILDVVVVVFFTRPLLSLLSHRRWFSKTRWTGFFGPDGGNPSGGGPRRPLATTPQEA